MDPISQGVVGITAAQCISQRKQLITASAAGLLAGMAPDLDILIRSSNDPLLLLEFHRQFTHSLLFIPIGGLICAIFFYWLVGFFQRPRVINFQQTYLYSTIGYATHGLLDASTSYGTQLFWPLSHLRVAWNNIAVVDPLFTLPLIALVITALLRRKKYWAYLAAIYALSYLGFGLYQEHRAYQTALSLAQSRGHTPIQLNVKPSFANQLVWKSIYQFKDQYFVDGLYMSPTPRYFPGTTIAKLKLAESFPWLQANSQQAKDIERFRWFSSDHLAVDPYDGHRIIDIRYSMLPQSIKGLWGITLSPEAGLDEHVGWVTHRSIEQRQQDMTILWQMILGQHSQALPSAAQDLPQ